jgi:hypothetical protein
MLCGYQSGAWTANCKINPVPTKQISLQTNKEELFVLGWRRIVLFDADIGRNAPLVFMT